MTKNLEIRNNGENRFCIVVKCPYHVYDQEWADLLFQLNWLLSHHRNGYFHEVGAFLEEILPDKDRGEEDHETS